MTDPLQILDQLYAALKSDVAVPKLSERLPGSRNLQHIEATRDSRVSRISQDPVDPGRHRSVEKTPHLTVQARVSISSEDSLGKVGKSGNAARSSVLSGLCDFPHSPPKTAVTGNEGETPPGTISTDAGVEDPGTGADPGLPISPRDVQAGISCEVEALATLGRTGPTALRDAVKIVRAKIRNAPALVERQAAGNRCHVCNERLDGTKPEVAVLQMKPGAALHMHAGECHDAHRHRRAAVVDRIMAVAGYGPRIAAEAASDAPNDGHHSPDLRDT